MKKQPHPTMTAVAALGLLILAPSHAGAVAEPEEAQLSSMAAAEFTFDGTIEEAMEDPEIAAESRKAPVVVHVTEAADSVAPASVTRTDGDTTLDVDGSGDFVDRWQARGRLYPGDGYVCAAARFIVNGSTRELSSTVCGRAASEAEATYFFRTYTGSPYFTDGDSLCNSWNVVQVSGRPCGEIIA